MEALLSSAAFQQRWSSTPAITLPKPLRMARAANPLDTDALKMASTRMHALSAILILAKHNYYSTVSSEFRNTAGVEDWDMEVLS